jgi:molybdopterin-guanine dinucleotide biosynthesis protein A
MADSIDNVTGVVLAGGSSRRMGFDKALLPWQGKTLLQTIVDFLAGIFHRVIVVGGRRHAPYAGEIEHVPDILQGSGAIVGIHAALAAIDDPRAFVMACDACFPSAPLIRFLTAHDPAAAWVCPRTGLGIEPLFSVYARTCMKPIEELVARNERSLKMLAEHVTTVFVDEPLLRRHDPDLRSFTNLNTPSDLAALRERGEEAP